jgi:hypothetical protein
MIRRTGIALTLALALASPAAAAWSPAQQLGPGGSVALATDGHGNRVIAWAAPDAVHVAFAHDGRAFRHARAIPGSEVRGGADNNQLAVTIDRSGRALVAWTYFDNRQPSTGEHSDAGCCSARKAAIVQNGVPRRAATLTGFTSPEDVFPGGQALGPGGRAAVVTDTSGANVATLSRAGRFVKDELPGGVVTPAGVYFRHGKPVVTYHDGDRLLDAVQIRPGHFKVGRTLLTGIQGGDVVTSPLGRQALAYSKPGGKMIAGVRAPGRPFKSRVLTTGGLVGRSGVAIADSGRALVAVMAGGHLATTTGGLHSGLTPLHLGPGLLSPEPWAAAVRSDGWGLFLYSSYVNQVAQPLDAAFVSPSGRIAARTELGATDFGYFATTAIDSRGAVVASLGNNSVLVSRSPVPARR